ncbi:DinB family protein [Hymenobacter chitinivorans]|uniref:DinB family protein n=1 Tax=Hymenobacter chitinivorans DSM 11115 TaxID=1121954 RepID=A0A2M9B9T8_9BACT|nr:DinB family protein [Hymenobacter chitinivorans]PJJ54710.1 DinB family protein [Hymenobacter chitinivorans DSM 11115]
MKSETSRMYDQLTRAFDGNAWSGPSLLATLQHLTASQAAARPIVQAHSIWEIVLHLTTWIQTVQQRVESRRVTPVTPAQDWPAQPTVLDEELWEATRRELQAAHAQLLELVASLAESDLEMPVGEEPDVEPGPAHSVYVLLHGLAQHNLYHAGQIALLRKALSL